MQLLIIDPQNDFMDLRDSALPVLHASAHMTRLAAFIEQNGPDIEGITVTMDWHQLISIERVTFWEKENGAPVDPFTQITAEDVRTGRFRPLLGDERVLRYLDALEGQGRYKLVAWPVHCCQGSWGANVYEPLQRALNVWALLAQRNVRYQTKGMNPWTEQYGAFAAEVPEANDPTTQENTALIRAISSDGGPIVVAGEASSHCVRRSVEQLLEAGVRPERLVLLSDCMGPVAGFEQQAQDFLATLEAVGARVCGWSEFQA